MNRMKSKTIVGIIIAAASVIIGQIARQTGAPMTEAEATEVLNRSASIIEQAADIVVELADAIGALIGLFLAYRGRMNPEIKPIAGVKK